MLRQSGVRVSSSLRGAKALRSRCGSLLKGLFSHTQQHNAGGTKQQQQQKNTLPLSIGPVPQEVELFAVGVPAAPEDRCAGEHSFIKCVR